MDILTIATIIGALAAVVALFLPWVARKLRSKKMMVVKRIQSPSDQDLIPALELYCRSIPENERDSQETIVRWLQEIEIETKEGRCKLKDYFLVAKVGNRVAGLLYGQYYPNRGLMFVSFMAVDREYLETRHCLASTALLRYLSRELRRGLKTCEGIVFELEYHGSGNKKHDRTCRARMRHFRALARTQNLAVKEIEVGYRQPKLSLWEGNQKEERQHLMYGRTKPPALSTTISRTEVERILRFLHEDIYGDHFEDDPGRDREFRLYLNGLYRKLTANLPLDRV